MSIAHLTSRHQSDDARIYKRSVSTLRKNGHRVYYVVRDDGRLVNEPHQDNLFVKNRSGLKQRLISTFEVMRTACRSDADILQFHDPEFLLFTWYGKLRGKKLIYDIHENFYVKFQFGGFIKTVILKRLFGWFERFALLFVDGVVAISDSLMELYKGKVHHTAIVRNVPLKSNFNFPKVNERNQNIIYISGNHTEQRNCSSIITALPWVIQKVPEVRVQFVGKYVPEGYLEHLKKLARENKVEDYVSFEPMLSYQENFKRAASAGLGLVLYEDNVNNRIGIPNRLFEYMAVGLPVVAEQFGELKKVIDKYSNGVCVDSSTGEGLAKGIIEIYADSGRFEEMGQNATNAINGELNFETEVKSLEYLYQEMKS